MAILHHQPFKSLYIVLASAIFVSKIPWILVSSIPPTGRPWPSWSYKRTVLIKLLRIIPSFSQKLKISSKRDLTKEESNNALDDAEFNWIQPLPVENLKGEVERLAQINGVSPKKIPGYWLFKKGWKPDSKYMKATENEKTVLHFHGGGYTLGSAHPSDICCNITRGLLQYSSKLRRMFGVDYRLSTTEPFVPENPIPTQIIDAAGGYVHLLSLGFRPENIIFAGDSAGGNLVLALIRYMRDSNIPSLPLPGAMVLFSPWTDISESREQGALSSNWRNAHTDLFEKPTEKAKDRWAIKAYLGKVPYSPEAEENPYISPSSIHLKYTKGIFKDFPKSFICVGGLEMMLDDSISIHERMKADGCESRLKIADEAVHDYVVFPFMEPERSEDLKKVAEWIDEL